MRANHSTTSSSISIVKLNNPLMGTETFIEVEEYKPFQKIS